MTGLSYSSYTKSDRNKGVVVWRGYSQTSQVTRITFSGTGSHLFLSLSFIVVVVVVVVVVIVVQFHFHS